MSALRLVLCILLMLATGCVNHTVRSTQVPAINVPAAPIPEAFLLDVGIVAFDPGIDDHDEDEDMPIYPEVRRAESLFLPNQLAAALQESGAWGAVRVLPDESQLTDLVITGKILHSDGEKLQLAVRASDSRGVTWLDKTYKSHASGYAYTVTARSSQDPFQAIFNQIANDLLAALEKVELGERREVRLVTELLFAQSFSEEAFRGYLVRGSGKTYSIVRLPAEEDPMLNRVRKIRERDHLFIDTLQDYYVTFDELMSDPYHEWRRLSYEEVIAIQELKAQSRQQLITGAIAVLGGIAAQVEGDHEASRAAGRIAVLGGAYIIKSGLYKRNETQIHVEALQELGESMEMEIAPKVIELEDRTITLSGSVEDQYAQWRDLLAEIYRKEVGDLQPLEAVASDPATL
ncbi:MAG: hypothetical protein NXI15_15345 [Gammaproteobacteria bacterium]|nr:hypothetical protein [Gammaproteobacteria bacterium]